MSCFLFGINFILLWSKIVIKKLCKVTINIFFLQQGVNNYVAHSIRIDVA